MELRILGPFELAAGDRLVAAGGAKQRALLVLLALHLNEVVARDRLIEDLWGEAAPATADKSVQVYVSALRRALREAGADGALGTHAAGYVLRLDPGLVDAHRFEHLLAEAEQEHDRARVSMLLRDALSLWRGAPLAEFASAPFAPAEMRRLEDLRLRALELRIETDLAAGRHVELVGELQRLVSRHPWRERLRAQLMIALYRSGRQAEALESYRQTRSVLVEQLGIEPGSELRDLHHAMLVHDAALEPESVAIPEPPRHHGTLPPAPNRTIGRAREVRGVAEQLRARSVRLLTLTGPGGVGKTRLALEAARAVEADFADGAYFVSLASLDGAQDVATAILGALAIVPQAGEPAEQAVERFLRAKHLLLVLDNCEHLATAAPFIGRLPAAGAGVTVLATSREALTVHAEQVRPVAPLALPEPAAHDDPGALAGSDAVALFCERARAHDPDFALSEENGSAVAAICRRLDGLPLAIELAAARCGLLSPGEIAARLQTTLGTLAAGARDAPARQRTLRATIDWSHRLLDDEEKECFARFAVFAGGATVDATEAITGAGIDTLDRLVAKNLLVRRRDGRTPTRLGMLATVREYAAERFATIRERESVRERHFRYFVAVARRHGADPALFGPDRRRHFACLDVESENLRAALRWAAERDDQSEALELSEALVEYLWHRDRYAEAVSSVEEALEKPGMPSDPALRARALCRISWPLWALGRGAEAPALLAEAEAIARTLADPATLALVLANRAQLLACQGPDRASPDADEALACAQASGDPWTLARAAYARTRAARTADELRERLDEAAVLLRQAGNLYMLADAYHLAARSSLSQGCDEDATRYLERAVPLVGELDEPFLWMLLCRIVGLAALFTGDTDAARDAFREHLELCRDLVVLAAAFGGLDGLAAVAAVHGKLQRAARLSGAAAAHRYGKREDPLDARLRSTVLEPARRHFGADAWDTAAREGRVLSLDEAIAYALDDRGG